VWTLYPGPALTSCCSAGWPFWSSINAAARSKRK